MEQTAHSESVVSTSHKHEKHILFGLGGETYGIPILQTQEIIADFELTVLPELPQFFDGVISLRGEAVPVINLRSRFNIEQVVREDSSRIIIIEMKPTPIGILVDRVYKVFSIALDEIEEPPEFQSGAKAKYIKGVTEIERKKFAILLDMQEILTGPEQIELGNVKELIETKQKESDLKKNSDDTEALMSEKMKEAPLATDEAEPEKDINDIEPSVAPNKADGKAMRTERKKKPDEENYKS